jgi:hypothetical protein
VLGLIAAATVLAALFAFSQGPDWVDLTRRAGFWTSAGAQSVASMGPTGFGAVVGLAGLLLLVVLGAVIGASPLRRRLTGLSWLVVAVAMALATGSAYAIVLRGAEATDPLATLPGVVATLAEVSMLALAGYGLGSTFRRRPTGVVG